MRRDGQVGSVAGRLVAWMAIAALLAGCTATSAPVPVVEPPADVRWTDAIDRQARLGGAPGCNQVGCWGGSLATLLFEIPENESLEALTLVLGESQFADGVDWELFCRA